MYVFYFPFSLFFGLQCKWHIFYGFDITAIYVLILDQKRRNNIRKYKHNMFASTKDRASLEPKTPKNIHAHKYRMFACMFDVYYLLLDNMLIVDYASNVLLL